MTKEDLDNVVREKLWVSEKGRCWICGNTATEVGHIISRRFLATRFDVHEKGNCHLLCRGCHSADHNGHLYPSYCETFIRRFGDDAYGLLRKRANMGKYGSATTESFLRGIYERISEEDTDNIFERCE